MRVLYYMEMGGFVTTDNRQRQLERHCDIGVVGCRLSQNVAQSSPICQKKVSQCHKGIPGSRGFHGFAVSGRGESVGSGGSKIYDKRRFCDIVCDKIRWTEVINRERVATPFF